MADKLIGKLTLDISDVEKKISSLNEWLGNIGAGVNLGDQLSKKFESSLKKLISEAQNAGREIGKAMAQESAKKEATEIETAAKAWKQYYDIMTKAQNAKNAGRHTQAQFLEDEANAIIKNTQELRKQAEATEAVTKAKRNYESAQRAGADKQAIKDARDAKKAQEELRKEIEASAKAREAAKNAAFNQEMKDEAAVLESLIALYQKKSEMDMKATQAIAAGNIDNANLYLNEEKNIEATIAALAKLYPELDKIAQADERVAEAELKRQTAVNTAKQAAEANEYKAQVEAINEYASALVALYNEQTKLNNAVASGKIVEGTAEYDAASQKIEHLEQAAVRAGEKLDQAGIKAANGMQSVQTAADNLIQSQARMADLSEVNALERITDAYNNLKNAINQYNIAKKSNDEAGMNYWQSEINSQMAIVNAIRDAVSSLNVEAGVRDQINQKIQEAVTLQNGFKAGVVGGAQGANELEMQLTGVATRLLSIMAIWRMMSTLVQNMVEYVSEYSDKMNEIQIITQKSNSEVAQLSETYKNIAEMMNVSTLDIAEAAVYFTRQGLPAEEIEQRLKNVTMYAKTANVEFKESSEIITAVVNSMGLVEQEAEDGRNATQRVADVFLKVGDSAATSGEEIGRAMQKAAASAGAFGVSFEWLTAAIATVSETTRQEARTIGTAFNTIIARLHQIRTTGYNQEDETKINDVAKALAKIDVALMDQYGNWRDMEDVWNDVAAKWGDLDGKTKSYIATSMAGVKQQNVFLAAMNDMSKTIEEGGRFWELYGLAMDSAGTASEKYATWTDSVAASQERLNIAQEKFYSILGSNVIKGWNDMMADYVGMIADGAEAWGSWTVILPVVTGAVLGLVVALNAAKLAATTGFAAIESHPVIAGVLTMVGVLGTLITMINAAASEIETQREKFDAANKAMKESTDNIQKLSSFQGKANEMFDSLKYSSGDAGKSIEDYNGLLEQLCAISPNAKNTVDALRDGLIDQSTAAKELNGELEKLINNQTKIAKAEAIKKYSNWTPSEGYNDYEDMLKYIFPKFMEDASDFNGFVKMLQRESSKDWFKSYGHLDDYNEVAKDAAKYIAYGMATDDAWELASMQIWKKIFGTEDVENGITNQAQEAIDEVVGIFEASFDDIQTGILRDLISEAVFGEDGILSIDEYRGMGKVIAKFLATSTEELVNNPAMVLNAIGQNMFGNYFSMIFEGQIEAAARDSELVQSISEAYQELLTAGFTAGDIAGVLEKVSIGEWDQMVDLMKKHMIDKMRSEFGEEFMMLQGDFGEEGIDMLDDLDVSAVKLMLDMKRAGMSADEFLDLFIESGADMDVFIQKLSDMSRGMVEGTDEAEEETETLLETIKKLTAEIDKYEKVINTLKKGEPVDMSDLLNIADAHPEIMAVINDTDSLLAAMQKLKEASMSDVVKNLRNNLLGSQEFAQQQTAFDTGGKPLGEYAGENGEAIQAAVDQYVNQVVASFLAHSGQLQNVGKDILGNWMNSIFSNSNVDLLNRKAVQIGEDFATVLTETFTASTTGERGIKWDADIVMNLTPITPDGKLMTDDEVNEYVDELLSKSHSIERLLSNDMIENGGKGLVISVGQVGEEGFDVAINNAETLAQLLHLLQEAYYGVTEAEKTWLELQIEQQELNASNEWAKNNGYIEQLSELNNALASGGSEGVIAATEIWNGYNQELQKAILDTYPELGRAILEAQEAIDKQTGSEEKAAAATEKLGKSLDKATKYATATKFKGTYDAIQKMQKGAISATGAYEAFDKELKEFEKAQKDVAEAQIKMADGTKLTTDDVSNLASALGMTAQQVIDDFPGALEMFEELRQAGRDAFDDLNREATMKILGISEADFSNITNGLIAVQNDAKATIEMLKATGQWELVTEDLPAEMPVFDVVNGKTVNVGTVTATGHQTLLRMKNTAPLSGGGGGGGSSATKSGGGGGGGGGKKNNTTEVARMLDNMSQVNDIMEYQQGYYQAQSKYYEQMGQLQGVIEYSKREIEVLNKQSEALEGNVATIEDYIEKKKQELAALSKDDAKYTEVAGDLDKLQKAHQEYTKRLIENKTAVDQLTKSIDDQQKKIRDMEINLRTTILKAIEDREKRTSDMLNGEISMENIILELIKKRYEKERDEIIETTNKKIEALQQERDLLDEQLQKRKEIAETEDKQRKLNELEMKYQRIIADPTRLKEANDIKKQIDDLREEMAWDLAEQEVKAQQESIDQQITSLDDYIEYVNNYYEELFENPQKLIAEMREIIKLSDEEIIAWLKAQDETFSSSSENTQKKMVEDWQNTLDQMRGVIKTHWEEVEEILAKGQDFVIEFLKENTEEYRKAGKQQAEAYVDEWLKQFEDLRKAYEGVKAMAAPEYDPVDKGEGGSGGSGGGGGGGGGGGNDTKENVDHGYSFTWITPTGRTTTRSDHGFKSADDASEAAIRDINTNMASAIKGLSGTPGTTVYDYEYQKIIQRHAQMKDSIKAYKYGGIADFTGPAWLDGSKELPERILNPYQNKLFETMVQALERMSTIHVPTMPKMSDMFTPGGQPVSVGDIIVNVDNLDTDDDYEELAEKVGNVLMERIGRTAVIGGLRVQSF